jgi:uncharacterized protein (TIRG00374 family)
LSPVQKPFTEPTLCEAPKTKRHKIKPYIAFTGKLLIAAGLMYWLYRQERIDATAFEALSVNLQTIAILGLGAVFVLGALCIMAWRLKLLLRTQHLQARVHHVLALTFIGALFGAVLPGLIAGDIVKAVYLCRDTPGLRSRVVAAVMIDRMIGLYGLLLLGTLACVAGVFTGNLPPAVSSVLFVAPALTLAATLVVVLIMTAGRLHSFGMLMERLPSKLVNLIRALMLYRNHLGAVLMAIGVTLVSQGLVVVSFFLVAVLLDDPLSISAHFVINPLAMVMNVVPLTPGGIGITESAFSYLYEWCGSPYGAAVGLLGRFIQYTVFIIGGISCLLFMRLHFKLLPESEG